MKAKGSGKPQSVGSILEKTLKRMSLDRKLKEHEVWNIWDSVVGEYVSRYAQPDRMRNKILFVRVSSSPWMQQLSYMSTGIVEALNERLGTSIVEEIRFKLGEVDPRCKGTQTPSPASNPIPSPGKGISRELRKALSSIKDTETRKILGQVILKDQGRREDR
jgi:hypothetical protein